MDFRSLQQTAPEQVLPLTKEQATQLLDQAWGAIHALSAAYRAKNLPADLFAHLPADEAYSVAVGDLAPLIYLTQCDYFSCDFDQVAESVTKQTNSEDPDPDPEAEG
jgi:hypothetical protein